jgi:hypothetical protein
MLQFVCASKEICKQFRCAHLRWWRQAVRRRPAARDPAYSDTARCLGPSCVHDPASWLPGCSKGYDLVASVQATEGIQGKCGGSNQMRWPGMLQIVCTRHGTRVELTLQHRSQRERRRRRSPRMMPCKPAQPAAGGPRQPQGGALRPAPHCQGTPAVVADTLSCDAARMGPKLCSFPPAMSQGFPAEGCQCS